MAARAGGAPRALSTPFSHPSLAALQGSSERCKTWLTGIVRYADLCPCREGRRGETHAADHLPHEARKVGGRTRRRNAAAPLKKENKKANTHCRSPLAGRARPGLKYADPGTRRAGQKTTLPSIRPDADAFRPSWRRRGWGRTPRGRQRAGEQLRREGSHLGAAGPPKKHPDASRATRQSTDPGADGASIGEAPGRARALRPLTCLLAACLLLTCCLLAAC